MEKFARLFKKRPALIGMIHVRALPGTPSYQAGMFQSLVEKAVEEAKILVDAGIDGLLIENMHDLPYTKRVVGPEVVSAMTSICGKVKEIAQQLPCGVQILSGCNKEALAVAKATSLQFVRAEGFVFAHVADEGFIESDAGSLLRYRKLIDADNILVFTDVKKKHSSHQVTSDVSLAETCRAAELFMSDGIIITGSSTGESASPSDFKSAQSAVSLPVILGSGVTAANVEEFASAQALIVGSYFKEKGHWANELCRNRIDLLVSAVRNYADR